MLQILDDGRLTDSQGRTVDFRNSVVIMTSNVGSQFILDLAGDDEKYDLMRDRVMEAMRSNFRPEFLNRVDELIIFHSLRQEQLKEIVRLQIQRLEQRLGDRKMSLVLSEEALDWVAQVGYDPVYGARPLKRAIQKELETPIAKGILRGGFCERRSHLRRCGKRTPRLQTPSPPNSPRCSPHKRTPASSRSRGSELLKGGVNFARSQSFFSALLLPCTTTTTRLLTFMCATANRRLSSKSKRLPF